MNELIKVTTNENDEQLVNGRELYEFLGVKDNYTDWFKRMIKYGFDENVDFISFSEKSDKPFGGRPQVNHYVKLDMAKEISMLQRTERGKQARRYFIQLEKFWNSPEMVTKRALEFQQKKIELLQLENESLKPKALFADAVDASKTSILIGDLAKLIKQNGIDIGQNRLFQWLRDNGYLIARKGESYNMPTQRSLDLGIAEIKERTHNNPDGSIRISRTPKITGKGQIYFVNKFLHDKTA
ncbi:oxidoreductase [Enterococcus faecalis]|uniref:phage antirepressor KilAC domain-containing protein n=1 Tax=Enterococcus TaxID=1350 RepID=UPI00157200DC|nr:phage antirepressor KilAC domain-containing protein [Enterococcus faecalis]MBO1125310.1 oxidoreductase [Enterococcus faecalis]MDN3074989.1 phage antirepressor KilAC domain-containing protein [Enterococcus faecalis]NSQ64109.1 phage antirepressor KilAC domain-containing protein [Enterococcus faecalis]NSU82277.1 phage antirepressor KilAC domain-containing protein [Enterococcus faecalis]NSV42301.1 phage antirepressor KilAC domain-containing protein [Enterococcus faecalis]